ncbi:MAG TPA: ATP-binding protein [Candidatus Polarisedimenticolaceae bacterium]|nr:ATP-binding protein [Candidatus Polarisedimenticolaceae bacterium]
MRATYLIALLLAAAPPSALGAQEARPWRVLMVHSFGASAPPFTTHSTAFESALATELGTAVDLDQVSLDMARYAQPDMEEVFAEYLTKRFSKWEPDLLVPIGSPAGRFVAKLRDRLFPRIPVVYTGMDKRTLPEDALAHNATFVGEDFDLPGLVRDMLRLDPRTKNVVVILGATPLERYWTEVFRKAFEPFQERVQFTWVNDLSFAQMQDLASALPPHSAILLALLLRDASGVTHNQDDALARLHQISRAPIYGMYRHQVGLGVVGGRLYQGEKQGIESARVAARILRGEPASRFPPLVIGTSEPTYDWRELRRWGISESRLPAGSVVLFRHPGVWDRYGWHITAALGVILVQAMLILALLVQRRRRHLAELAYHEAQAEVQQKRTELAHVARLASLGELTAALAHEINQPLAAIRNNSSAALRFLGAREPDLGEVRETLGDIQADSERAGEIVHRLAGMLKRDTPGLADVDLNHAIGTVERIVRSDAVRHGVTVHLDLAPGALAVRGDGVQLQQVVLNLMVNAFSAMSEPGANGTRRLVVRTRPLEGTRVLVEVTDSGTGIPPDQLERIFDPFITSKHDGLGMGLAICRSIVERHGGKLWAVNNPDHGATFSITLPAGQG